MSDVAQAARAAKTKPAESASPATATPAPAAPAAAAVVAPAAAAPPRAQKLREAQVRKLTIGRFKPVGHFSEPQQAILPAEWDFEDALKPEFWTFIAPSMQANLGSGSPLDRIGTVIEIRSEDHAFYGIVYVKRLRRNGQGQADALDVVCIGPAYDPETGACHALDLNVGGPWMGRRAPKAAG